MHFARGSFGMQSADLPQAQTSGSVGVVKNRKTTVDADELEAAVERLTEEVRVLRQSIDEFREDFVHLLRQLPENLPPPYAHLGTLTESFAVDLPEPEEPVQAPTAKAASALNTAVASRTVVPRKQTLFD